MDYLFQFLIVLSACIIFLVFFSLKDRKEFFGNPVVQTGFLGPDFDKITNKDFVKVKCYPNMSPSDVAEFNSMGQVCGADYDNWEKYPCVFHNGRMEDEPRCLEN